MKYIRRLQEVNNKDRHLIKHFNIVANFLKEKAVVWFCVRTCACVCVCVFRNRNVLFYNFLKLNKTHGARMKC